MINIRFAAAAAALCVGCYGAASAQTQINRTDLHIVIENTKALNGTTVTAGRDQPVMTTKARSPRAVRLKDRVEIGLVGTTVALEAGTVLFGRFDNSVWTYCSVGTLTAESLVASTATLAVLSAGVSLLAAGHTRRQFECLYDADNDGVFDTAWGGGVVTDSDARLSFEMASRTITTHPAYERVDLTEGPASPLSLTWQKQKNAPQIEFRTMLAKDQIGRVLVPIPAPGAAPQEFNLFSATLTLDAYNATAQTVTVTIKDGFEDFYARVPATQIITTTYY